MSQEAAKLDRFMLHLREYVSDAPKGSQAPSCARPGCSEHVTYRPVPAAVGSEVLLLPLPASRHSKETSRDSLDQYS